MLSPKHALIVLLISCATFSLHAQQTKNPFSDSNLVYVIGDFIECNKQVTVDIWFYDFELTEWVKVNEFKARKKFYIHLSRGYSYLISFYTRKKKKEHKELIVNATSHGAFNVSVGLGNTMSYGSLDYNSEIDEYALTVVNLTEND